MTRGLRRLAPLLAAAALLGCAAGAPARAPATSIDLLFLGAGPAIRALEPATGRVRFQAEAAQPLADWSALVAAEPTGRLDVLDGSTGAVRASQPLDGTLAVRAVSVDGRLAALTAPSPGASPYAPVGREQTTLWITQIDGGAPRRYELSGNLEPEAFSVDDGQLFALEWLPPAKPDRYRVRRIDLLTGETSPVFTREKAPNLEEMRGEGRQQVLAPNRQTLYTLYTAQPDHVHARDMLRRANGLSTPMVHAFVHTLGLDWGWTYCVDLPLPLGLGPSAAHTIAVSPGGERLYVADLSSGAVVRVATADLRVDAQAHVEPDPAAGAVPAASAVGPDGTLYLAGGSGVVVLDGATLAVKARYPLKAAAAGLALSPDGRRLYVGQPGGVLAFETTTGRHVGSTSAPPFDLLRHAATSTPR